MKRNTDEGDFDDEEEYQWQWRVTPMMMKRNNDDCDEEEVNKPNWATMLPDFVTVCTKHRTEREWNVDWQMDGQTDFKMDC